MTQATSFRQNGSLLLEGMIAILIFSFGVIALMGMQAASIKNTSDAKYRVSASLLANRIIGQMWVDRANLASYATPTTWLAQVAAELPNGGGGVTIGTDPNTNSPRATVTVTWQLPGQQAHQYVAVAEINGAP